MYIDRYCILGSSHRHSCVSVTRFQHDDARSVHNTYYHTTYVLQSTASFPPDVHKYHTILIWYENIIHIDRSRPKYPLVPAMLSHCHRQSRRHSATPATFHAVRGFTCALRCRLTVARDRCPSSLARRRPPSLSRPTTPTTPTPPPPPPLLIRHIASRHEQHIYYRLPREKRVCRRNVTKNVRRRRGGGGSDGGSDDVA
jgi:hypothetical protein